MERRGLVLFVTNLTKKYQTLVKLKSTMSYFFKEKAKNVPKASKTVKNLNNGETKSVLEPIKQSKTITQELETVEKPHIFDIDPVIIEHPKSVIKLSKTKMYTESKVADRTLQSDFITKHVLIYYKTY